MKNLVLLYSLCFLLTSCEKSQAPRTYTEETSESTYSAAHEGHDHASDQSTDPHAGMNMENLSGMDMLSEMGSGGDPHAGFTKEQLADMLKEQGQPLAPSESPLLWKTPKDWEEKTATGMRIATFVSKADPAAIDTSIVTLGPGAGGLEANIVRWLGQINITSLSPAQVETFTKEQETIQLKNNVSAILVNFTTLQKNDPDTTASMIAAIIDTPAQRVFVKMTGEKGKVLKNFEAFKSLVLSIEFR